MTPDEFFDLNKSEVGPWITVWRGHAPGAMWSAEIYTETDEPPVLEAAGMGPDTALAALIAVIAKLPLEKVNE